MIHSNDLKSDNILLFEFNPDPIKSYAEDVNGKKVPINGLRIHRIYDPREGKVIADYDNALDGVNMSDVNMDDYKDKKYGVAVSAPNPSIGFTTHHWIAFEVAGHAGENQEFVLALQHTSAFTESESTYLDNIFPGYREACSRLVQ